MSWDQTSMRYTSPRRMDDEALEGTPGNNVLPDVGSPYGVLGSTGSYGGADNYARSGDRPGEGARRSPRPRKIQGHDQGVDPVRRPSSGHRSEPRRGRLD